MQLLDRFGLEAAPDTAGQVFPAVNLYETSEGYVLRAELPGLRSEDLDLAVEGDQVTIRGRREIAYDESASLHRRERPRGRFARTVRLPVMLDPDKAEAVYENGVLVLKVAKAPEHRPRQISVQGR